jgi:hypothetical protein
MARRCDINTLLRPAIVVLTPLFCLFLKDAATVFIPRSGLASGLRSSGSIINKTACNSDDRGLKAMREIWQVCDADASRFDVQSRLSFAGFAEPEALGLSSSGLLVLRLVSTVPGNSTCEARAKKRLKSCVSEESRALP